MNRADIVQVKIIAAIGRRDAQRRQVAIEWDARADLVGRGTENFSRDLRGGGFVGLAAIRRAEMQAQRAVFFEFNRCAVDATGAGRFFHLGEDCHVARSVSPAGLDADDDADAHQPSLFARFLLFLAQFVVVDFLEQGREQAGVIAAVVDIAANGPVRHFIGLN